MIHLRLSVCILLLTLTPSTQALSLLDAVKLAELNDPAHESIKANLEAAKLGPDVARAGLLPQVLITARVANNKLEQDRTTLNGGLINLGGTTDYDSNDVTAQVVQPLFDMSAYRQYEASLLQKSKDEALAIDQVQRFRMQVVSAYIDVLRASATLELAEGREHTLIKRLEDAKIRFKLGTLPRLDMLETQAQFDQTRSQRLTAQNTLESSRNVLASKVGVQRITLPRLKTNLPLIPFVPIDKASWIKLAKERSPSLLANRLDIEVAEKELGTAKASYLPQVNAVASISQRDVSGGDNLAISLNSGRTEQIGVELRWELFGGGRATNRAKQLAQRNQALREDLKTSEINLSNQVGNLFATALNDAQRVNSNRSAVASATESRNAIAVGYKLGTHSILELQAAENRLQSAKQEQDSSYFDYLQNSLNLHATSGVLYYSILARYSNAFDITIGVEPPDSR